MSQPISIFCWKWGDRFSHDHVNVLSRSLERHLTLEHHLYCVTDNPRGIRRGVTTIDIPTAYSRAPRCRRRMQQYATNFHPTLGDRRLVIDLDVVITASLDPILDRDEPIVGWRVGHAGV